jgi:predicted DNA-binding transcriptional regulator YafY
MIELQTKIKRQIEILGIAVDNPAAWRAVDLSELYGCEELTVKRDLQELRSYGFDLHSEKKRGIRLGTPLDQRRVQDLITQYLGLSGSDYTVDKATALMVRKLKEKALSIVVTLQRCIDRCQVARIDYQKEAEDLEKGREIQPLLIFQSDGFWRVLAVHDGVIKQYHLNKIVSAAALGRKFRRVPQERIDEMFRYSFKSWIGNERHTVTIRLSKTWADRIRPQQTVETQNLTVLPDGSVVFEAIVNSLKEVASSVISKGEGVQVIDPPALRETVIALARGALKNYESAGWTD